jgi:hypothetical protein
VSLTGLDDERVDRLLLHLRSSRVELGMNQETGGEMRALGLLEFDSAVAADSALLVQRAMSELRDTQLQEGPVRIVSSRYGDVSGADGLRGFQVLKTVATPVGEQNVLTLVVVRGALQAEASSSCGDEPATIEAWLRAALAAAHGETPADAPAPVPESDLGNSAPAPQQTGG